MDFSLILCLLTLSLYEYVWEKEIGKHPKAEGRSWQYVERVLVSPSVIIALFKYVKK